MDVNVALSIDSGFDSSVNFEKKGNNKQSKSAALDKTASIKNAT